MVWTPHSVPRRCCWWGRGGTAGPPHLVALSGSSFLGATQASWAAPGSLQGPWRSVCVSGGGLVSTSLSPFSFSVNLSRTPRCRGKLSYRTEVQQVAQLLVGPYSGHALLLGIHLRPLLTGPKAEKKGCAKRQARDRRGPKCVRGWRGA